MALPNIALATRYIRLTHIHLMLGFAGRVIQNQASATPTGGAVAPQNDERNG